MESRYRIYSILQQTKRKTMIGLKILFRGSVFIFTLAALLTNGVGVISTILWTIGALFFYLFFIEYWFLSICAGQDNPGWISTAHKFYVTEKMKIPYLKFMALAFILMLTYTYEE